MLLICHDCLKNSSKYCGCMDLPPPTPPPSPESPCPRKIAGYLKDMYEYHPRARRSLAEIFELVMNDKEFLRKSRRAARRARMSTGGKK